MPLLGEILGSLFGNVAGAQDGTHVRIWNELKPWLGNLAPAATRKWLPHIARGVECEVPLVSHGAFTRRSCEHLAVAACDVCHRPVCLHHARIDHQGDAICYICVADAMQAVPPLQRARARARGGQKPQPPPGPAAGRQHDPPVQKPPPTQEQKTWAYGVLGLKRSATWKQVQAAHRKLSAKHHPDKQQSAQPGQLYLDVQTALHILKQIYPEAA